MSQHSERARQWVHIGSAGFALLLRALTWQQAAVMAAIALAFNALLLPRMGGRRLYRPADRERGFPIGILLYPTAVLLLILFFRSRLDIAAAAWAILAFGDGSATLVGRGVQRNAESAEFAESTFQEKQISASSAFIGRALPWNPNKTIAGTIAFFVFGAAGAIALAWWTRPAIAPEPSMLFVVAAPIAAAAAAALVESLPARLDDNISVPFAAGAVLWLASLMDADAHAAWRLTIEAREPWAIGVNAVVASLGYRARTVSLSGTVVGAVIGIVIWIAGGAAAWGLLFASFFAATAASRLGLARKTRLGIAEERGGRRGAGNAIANCGVAVIAAVAAITTPYTSAALVAFAAALTAGGSDTVAS
ncbi:MAG TPA: DUF92 domain-containing protein, partial [Vicinamibacterales bacterium]|nr:DUF92 domain-containing protein [Vicinamibacterales bacterium]